MILKRREDAQCMFPADSCDKVRAELESKDREIKILREALELIKLDQKYNYGKGSYELSHASEIAQSALVEADEMKDQK